MDLNAARDALVQEARELLADMEAALLEMEVEGASPERINSVFRAAHTIKGSAGLFGLDLIVGFTHVVESVLDRVRGGNLQLSGPLVATLLRSADYVGALVDAVDAGTDAEDPDAATRASLLTALGALLEREETAPVAPLECPAEAAVEHDCNCGPCAENGHWHISLRFSRDVLRNGMDPLSFIHYLGTLGELVYVYTLSDALPAADEMDPEACYLGFEIDLKTDATRQTIEDVFEFVRDDAVIRIIPPCAKISDYVALIESLPENGLKLGEILVMGGTITQNELDAMLARQAKVLEETGRAPRLGEMLVEEQLVAAPVVGAALSKQQQPREERRTERRTIKVDASKLDELINLVGELVIASAGARVLAERSGESTLAEALAEVGQLVGQIRDGALDMRMVPIGEVFQRFPRVVRDVSQELGKKIDLVITGADTELDKSMVEKLADPLMHIVRNAIDHGIEPVEVRAAAGKPENGKVRLHAYHESGYVVVEVSDDGKGLDAARIRAKAIERGMIAADAQLSESEIYKLIFAAGFSTAEQITNISGRGVGMDVVMRSIEALRGDIELESRPGEGTTLRLRLPLTLAIINGFLVGVGDSVFVVPLDMIEECVELSAETGRDYTNLRGQVLPFIRLREMLEVGGEPAVRQNIVVVRHAGQKVGLVVDVLLGEFQTVIKPLGKMFKHVKCISGSSILGSGDVALILDVPVLIQQAASASSGALKLKDSSAITA